MGTFRILLCLTPTRYHQKAPDLNSNAEFQALRFNAWMGAYGATAVAGRIVWSNMAAGAIKAVYESSYALHLNQLRDPASFLASLKQPRTPFAVWLRQTAVDRRWSYFIAEVDIHQTNTPISPRLKNDIIKFANSLLFDNLFYTQELFQGVAISPLSQRLVQVPPQSNAEQVKIHRSLLQDAYPGLFSPLEEVSVEEK